MKSERMTCLMYHELEAPGHTPRRSDPGYRRYVVAEHVFASHLRLLSAMGMTGCNVGDALAHLDGRHVALTFDDGCESDLTVAAVLLRDAAMNATFYVSSALVGQPGYLTHSQLRSLSNSGFDIGCHGATHRYLPNLSDADLDDETAGAKLTLERVLGRPVDHFSCPGGRWDMRVRDAVMCAGFSTCATSDPGTNGRGDRIVRRNAVLSTTSESEFVGLVHGRRSLTAKFRDAALRGSKKVLGTAAYESARDFLLGRTD